MASGLPNSLASSASSCILHLCALTLWVLQLVPLLEAQGQSLEGMRFVVKHISSLPSKVGHSRAVYNNDVATLNQSSGEYFALMQLGTPPTEIAEILDTGSELVWVQCQPCIKCQQQAINPIFNPANSTTFRNISCDSSWCVEKPNDGVTVSCDKSDTCLFSSAYVDNSSSSGYMAQDTLRMSTSSVPNFVFGCANYAKGSNLNASGTMGLDRGTHSAVSQLGVQVFTYCFPDRTENIDSEGFISFGGTVKTSSENLQYTKLIQNTGASGLNQLYYVNLTGISVGSQLLDIPASALQLNLTSGSGGTIIDSGTTLTYLMDSAFSALKDAFDSQTTGQALKVNVPGESTLELCYVILAGSLEIPTVTFHFEGSVNLTLPKYNTVTLVAPATYCLAFANARYVGNSMNIIGNIQQQNVLMEFNLETSQLGFGVTNCSGIDVATEINSTTTATTGSGITSTSSTNSENNLSSSAALALHSKHVILELTSLLASICFSLMIL